jgi:hypothetical protein
VQPHLELSLYLRIPLDAQEAASRGLTATSCQLVVGGEQTLAQERIRGEILGLLLDYPPTVIAFGSNPLAYPNKSELALGQRLGTYGGLDAYLANLQIAGTILSVPAELWYFVAISEANPMEILKQIDIKSPPLWSLSSQYGELLPGRIIALGLPLISFASSHGSFEIVATGEVILRTLERLRNYCSRMRIRVSPLDESF